MNNRCCGKAEMPNHCDRRINTLVVACAELDDLSNWNIRRFLGPYMTIRSAGAIPDISDSKEGRLLADLVTGNPNITHLVICAHSLCAHFGSAKWCSDLSQTWREDDMCAVVRDLVLENPGLRPRYRSGLLQQRWLSNMVRRLRTWSMRIGRPDLEIHAWIYEPEMDWISTLDQETDIFVPLNACTKLLRAVEA